METKTQEKRYHGEYDFGGKEPKVIITPQFKNIIDHLHLQIGNVEFSGQLFYHFKGSIANPEKMVITPIDFHLMDIGSSAHTSFDADASIIDVYDRYPEFMENNKEYRIGFLHSHHNMSTFFSGEDLDELRLNTHKYPFYFSLIVNFNGIWDARLCFESEIVNMVTYTDSHTKKQHKLKSSNSKSLIRLLCDIQIPVPNYVNERLKEVQESKKAKVYNTYTNYQQTWNDWEKPINQTKIVKNENVATNNNSLVENFPNSSYSYTQLLSLIFSCGDTSDFVKALEKFIELGKNEEIVLSYVISEKFIKDIKNHFKYVPFKDELSNPDFFVNFINKISNQFLKYEEELIMLKGVTTIHINIVDEFLTKLELFIEETINAFKSSNNNIN